MKKIKINDTVIVLVGKDKGRTGKVLRFLNNDRVLVEGINIVKKNVRANPQRNVQGGVEERESGIHISNISLVNPVTNKAGRIGFKSLENGEKVRYFKSNNEVVTA